MAMKSRGTPENTSKTYLKTLENLDEMDLFLDAFDQPNLNQ
jgi:hypothetical protein